MEKAIDMQFELNKNLMLSICRHSANVKTILGGFKLIVKLIGKLPNAKNQFIFKECLKIADTRYLKNNSEPANSEDDM